MAPLGKMSVMTHARPCAIFSRKLIKPQNKARGQIFRRYAYTFFLFFACFKGVRGRTKVHARDSTLGLRQSIIRVLRSCKGLYGSAQERRLVH